MRLFCFLIIAICLSLKTIAQNSEEANKVLDQFGLTESDHRGIILHFKKTNDVVIETISLNEALLNFLSSTEKRDLTHYYVTSEEDKFGLNDKPIDVMQIAHFYLLTKED